MTRQIKPRLRRELIARRRALSAATVIASSQQVSEKVVSDIDFSACSRVHIYTPIYGQNEIDPTFLAAALTACYPRMIISWGETSSQAPLPTGKFDAIFTPVVGFNRDGFRLGFGGGWYDRFLAAQPEALKIGLAYDWAEVDFAPQPHDIPLDLIATETALLHVYL